MKTTSEGKLFLPGWCKIRAMIEEKCFVSGRKFGVGGLKVWRPGGGTERTALKGQR